ncbi:MAG: hypothetical protein LE180_05645 [Endomicrobium sp.]|nr:hypothetical protein [Endomicrobium sp.]
MIVQGIVSVEYFSQNIKAGRFFKLNPKNRFSDNGKRKDKSHAKPLPEDTFEYGFFEESISDSQIVSL